ncbi:response regulator [Cytobacillus oceanisediminis]|uniref:ATP-binding protein n=1 Tax=Cytobacillus oceanisediminis TaxID=665099 RepID=UPI001D15DA20|nr:ATP-binding protein [Cytobacillus oceanisediminis]MCC3646675.1 response regulator [Cytobacillus oceanisediminis]
MKLNHFIKKSLTRQIVALMGVFVLLFLAGTSILILLQEQINSSYYKEREKLIKKEEFVQQIDHNFNLVFFDVRGYFAFGNPELKNQAAALRPQIRKLISEYNGLASTNEDKAFGKEMDEFADYYFIERLPVSIEYFEAGRMEEIIKMADSGATARINSFQDDIQVYLQNLNDDLNGRVQELIQKQSYIQTGFFLFLVVTLVILFRMIRIMFKQVGQPLTQFANAAEEIARGGKAELNVGQDRMDELAVLSVAFQKMVVTLQEKEQDLLAQNEELIAQQDELQAQRGELEDALGTMQSNERKLERRNELINGISNSLKKQEVLESIVMNMSNVIEADCGIIVMLENDESASFGISSFGVEQFKNHLRSGLIERLKQTKEGFAVKRQLLQEEKGYHVRTVFGNDLYLPVISSNQEVTAVMVFTRYGFPFAQSHMDEYSALSKQIGLSLDKISSYENSEANRKLNQDILNTVKEGLQYVDRDGCILQVNKQLCEMFHCEGGFEGIVGLTWDKWSVLLKQQVEDEDGFTEFIWRAFNGKTSSGETFVYKTKDRGHICQMYCEDLYQNNECVGTVLVHRDITKEFKVDEMKSEFVSTVSHELRTPLASILGFSELLLNRELKAEKQKKYLMTILNEAKRLTSLINDFLDVQRMESGKQTYEKKYIELLPIIEKVIDNQQVQTDVHNITLEPFSGNDVILGDSCKIEQVFSNLISNAIKYSPSGGPVNIRLFEENSLLHIEVEDHGLGIPENAAADIFNKFYRVDNSDRRRIGGTGLGLSIVQEIVKAHDGNISVKSKYGKGSTFIVSIPAVYKPSHGLDENIHQSGTRYEVLVIEDDQSLAELFIQELTENNLRAKHFNNGRDVLEYLENHLPDAIVLDIMLDEGLDGWSIMKILKRNEVLSLIPIIISTALDEKEKGLSLGAHEYLIKPYQAGSLSMAIMQTLLKVGKAGQILIPENSPGD